MGEDKNRASQLSQILLCVLVFIFACCAIVFVALYFIKYGEDNADEDDKLVPGTDMRNIFTNDASVEVASTLLNNADLTLDPCKDFYEYACSNYVRYTPIPEDGQEGVFMSLRSGLLWRLKALLEREFPPNRYPQSVYDALNFYKACMNEDKIEELGLAPIQDLVDFHGGFPVASNNWDPNNLVMEDFMAKIIRTMTSFSLFFTANINLGVADTSKYGLQMQQTNFLLSRDVLMEERNSSLIEAYEQLAIDIAVLMGADQATAENDMKAMVDWEREMAPLLIPPAEARQLNFEELTVQELYDNITDKFDWLRFFNGVFETTDRTITLNDTVELHHRVWIERVFDKWDTLDKRIIANNMMLRMIYTHRVALPKKFRDAVQKFNQVRRGTTSSLPRWEECTQEASGFMSWAVGRLYVEEIFDSSYQDQVDNMLRLMKATMDTMLDEVYWLDDSLREAAKLKLSKMKEQVGFPDYILDDDRLKAFYPLLVVNPEAYLVSRRSRYESFKYDFLLRMDKTATQVEDWYLSPVVFNAAYVWGGNAMVFPAAFFTEPVFHKDYPKYVNFGLSGSIMGHEMTHGFDDRGRNFDENGQLNNWWTPEFNELFKNLSQCFVDQYDNFEVAGKNVNGKLTLGENIADHGGAVLSFRTYKAWLKENSMESEPALPGLDLTPSQLFFLGFAQLHCYTATEATKIHKLNFVWAPEKYRVNGPLQNIREFAEAFKCPVNSPMNPEKKCFLWQES